MTASDENQICTFCNGPVGVEPWGILSADANICVACMETHLCIYKSAYPAQCAALLDRVQTADVSWFKGRRLKPKRQRQRDTAFEAEKAAKAEPLPKAD